VGQRRGGGGGALPQSPPRNILNQNEERSLSSAPKKNLKNLKKRVSEGYMHVLYNPSVCVCVCFFFLSFFLPCNQGDARTHTPTHPRTHAPTQQTKKILKVFCYGDSWCALCLLCVCVCACVARCFSLACCGFSYIHRHRHRYEHDAK